MNRKINQIQSRGDILNEWKKIRTAWKNTWNFAHPNPFFGAFIVEQGLLLRSYAKIIIDAVSLFQKCKQFVPSEYKDRYKKIITKDSSLLLQRDKMGHDMELFGESECKEKLFEIQNNLLDFGLINNADKLS